MFVRCEVEDAWRILLLVWVSSIELQGVENEGLMMKE